MIRVTVELIPGGGGPPKLKGTALIWNTGDESARTGGRRGSYQAKLLNAQGRLWREVRISGFPRRALLAWDLLFRVLLAAVAPRNWAVTRAAVGAPSDPGVASLGRTRSAPSRGRARASARTRRRRGWRTRTAT